MITQTVITNLVPVGVLPVVHLNQYDADSDALIVKVYKGQENFNLTGCSARIQGTKQDGKGFSYSGTVDTDYNQIIFDITNQMTVFAGKMLAEVRLTKNSDDVGTLNLVFDIEESPLLDDTEISETEIPALIDVARSNAQESAESAEDAEAWAVGQRGGEDVPSTDETYHNNSKYWAEHPNIPLMQNNVNGIGKPDGTTAEATDGTFSVKAVKMTNNNPIRFGVDGQGNYGYIKAGADTVTPFKTGDAPTPSGNVNLGTFTSNGVKNGHRVSGYETASMTINVEPHNVSSENSRYFEGLTPGCYYAVSSAGSGTWMYNMHVVSGGQEIATCVFDLSYAGYYFTTVFFKATGSKVVITDGEYSMSDGSIIKFEL